MPTFPRGRSSKSPPPIAREAKIRAVIYQQFQQPRVVRKDVKGPRLDLGKDAFVEVFDHKRHSEMLANMLTPRKGVLSRPARSRSLA